LEWSRCRSRFNREKRSRLFSIFAKQTMPGYTDFDDGLSVGSSVRGPARGPSTAIAQEGAPLPRRAKKFAADVDSGGT
jgi:hypothetical protein